MDATRWKELPREGAARADGSRSASFMSREPAETAAMERYSSWPHTMKCLFKAASTSGEVVSAKDASPSRSTAKA